MQLTLAQPRQMLPKEQQTNICGEPTSNTFALPHLCTPYYPTPETSLPSFRFLDKFSSCWCVQPRAADSLQGVTVEWLLPSLTPP